MKHISHSVVMLIYKIVFFLGSENPQLIEERPLHAEKITVWYALWSEGVIGLYFCENDDGTTVTVNSFLLLLKNTTWRI